MRRLLLAASSLLATAIAPAARADADPTLREETTRLMGQAQAEYDAGRFDVARGLYGQACERMHTPKCVFSLAMAEARDGYPLDAYRHFREALADPAAIPPEHRKKGERMQAEAYAKLGHIAVHAPEGAAIAIDRVELPLPVDPVVDVMPGRHFVEARLGAQHAERWVTSGAGDQAVSVELPIGAGPAGPPADPSSPSPPAATEPDRSAGPGWRWTPLRMAGAGAAGFGVVAFGLGALFHAQAQAKADHASSLVGSSAGSACASGSDAAVCSDLRDTYSAQKLDGTLTEASLIVGAVAVAFGTTLLLLPERTPQTALVPLAAPHSAGLGLRGEF
jgi:hypothetical protein